MNSSLRWRKGKISIDWLPNFSLKQLFSQKENRLLSAALPLPKRLARALLEAHQIGDRPLSSYSKSEEQQLQILKNDLFAPAGTFGLSRAEVTRGGVSTSEVDPQTMESRLVSNLFIAGELLDVTGELGGYNLQWAFSTAQVAARAIEERNRTHLP